MVVGTALDDDLLGHAARPHVMMMAAVALNHDPCLRIRGCDRERCSECEDGREQQELPKHERLQVSRPGGRQPTSTAPNGQGSATLPVGTAGLQLRGTSPQP